MGYPQVVDELRGHEAGKLLHHLELDDYGPGHYQIGDVGAGNLATVVERKPLLALVADAEVIELDYQRALVSGLEQARAKGVVNREGGAEDGVGQLLMDEWYERPPERARAPFV